MSIETNSLSHWFANLPSSQGACKDSDTYVKDSSDFAKRVHEVDVHTWDRMVSLDKVSLFTWVPIDEALEVMSTLLWNDETLEERTNIATSDFCQNSVVCN